VAHRRRHLEQQQSSLLNARRRDLRAHPDPATTRREPQQRRSCVLPATGASRRRTTSTPRSRIPTPGNTVPRNRAPVCADSRDRLARTGPASAACPLSPTEQSRSDFPSSRGTVPATDPDDVTRFTRHSSSARSTRCARRCVAWTNKSPARRPRSARTPLSRRHRSSTSAIAFIAACPSAPDRFGDQPIAPHSALRTIGFAQPRPPARPRPAFMLRQGLRARSPSSPALSQRTTRDSSETGHGMRPPLSA
jgi:hypothetical protein